MENNSYLSNIDTEKVTDVMCETEENSKYFEETSLKVVSAYTDVLDSLMKEIYSEVISIDYPPLDILEKYFQDNTNAYILSDDVYSNPLIDLPVNTLENGETEPKIEPFSIQQYFIDHYKKLEKIITINH